MENALFDSPLYRKPRKGRKLAVTAVAVAIAAIGTALAFTCPYALPVLFVAFLPLVP